MTLHNVRNRDYRSETDYTPVWETRSVRLSHLSGADIAVNYWGSPWMGHPIVSFQFDDAPPSAFPSKRERKSARATPRSGLYRHYELIYIVTDERDVLRVRTNYGHGEDVYLYRMNLPMDEVREGFLEYLHTVNSLHDRPRWYNAVTTNIRTQHPAAKRLPWDSRILLNGKADEMMYEHQSIATNRLRFKELKKRA